MRLVLDVTINNKSSILVVDTGAIIDAVRASLVNVPRNAFYDRATESVCTVEYVAGASSLSKMETLYVPNLTDDEVTLVRVLDEITDILESVPQR